jgi:predicted  nucleic acid-binding Zn-ribbon protein
MEGHEERAAEAEYELAELEEQSDKLADDIEQAKDDWAQKQQDASVPGAGLNEDVEGDTDATGEGTPEVED